VRRSCNRGDGLRTTTEQQRGRCATVVAALHLPSPDSRGAASRWPELGVVEDSQLSAVA
jgi:hypothetical protein